ncbi:hypothetical protein AHAS_Ahas15G0237900 [Arachis hypogaea]
MFSGWRCKSRLIMVGSSKLKSMNWCSAQLDESRRVVWSLHENSSSPPLVRNQSDQIEDECENKVWDPRLQGVDQLWDPMVCEELHQSLELLTLNDEERWKSNHWWMFKDGFKHKPP